MKRNRAARRERVQHLARIDGVTASRWLEATPYSEAQYRYWLGNGQKTGAPNTEQMHVICTTFDWSLNWIFWGIGPMRLSQVQEMEAAHKVARENNDLLKRVIHLLS